MAKSAPSLSSFTGGELTPRLSGRTGLAKYTEGLSDLTNFLVLPQGGVTRRPGTAFLGEVKDSDDETRLIPFHFKTSAPYLLEFDDQLIRVYRNGQQILNATSKTISAVTKASPGVVTATDHGYSNGDEIFIAMYSSGTTTALSSGTMIELHGRNYLVANVTTHTFTLTDLHGVAIDTTNFSTFNAGESQTATEIYEIATIYPKADLSGLNYVQSADTMYVVHSSYKIQTLTRTANNAWAFSDFSVAGTPSPTINSADHYPSVVTFFEQRLVFANTATNPQTLWFSKNGDYDNFAVGSATADDALIYTIASNTVNEIRWMSATRVLTVGTAGGEFVVTTSSEGPITPTTTLIRKYSNYGSASVAPVQVADVTLFLQRNGRKVREFRYVGDVDEFGYQAPDMTILSEHITEGGIREFVYQQ